MELSDKEFEHRMSICDLVGADFISRWSIYETITCVEDFDIVIHPNDITVEYNAYGYEPVSIQIKGPVTQLDMWKAADQLMKLSGDLHHVFIEGFGEVKPGVLELYTGS